ncbi:MAG TPA: acylphosphatase [Saprospiraceae bacterium]|nr:acylphosphatase [Saprospiraceae bacterium]
MSRKALRLHIRGKVQGVWFRASTKEKADQLELAGFVRNEADGSVYIEVCGPSGPVERFADWCHQGPEHAVVTECLIEDIPEFDAAGFDIRRT